MLPKHRGASRAWLLLNSQPAPEPTDTTPDAFEFAATTNAALAEPCFSTSITVTGINAPAALMVTAGTAVSVNGGSFAAPPASVVNDTVLVFRRTSSASYATPVSTEVTIGGVTATWVITTQAAPADTTPAPFFFDPVLGADPATPYESNEIELTDFDGSVPLTVAGGQMNKNAAGWASADTTAVEGDRVRVRRTSSALWATASSVVLSAGPTTGAFTITTMEDPGLDPASEIISLTVMGATALDATGDYGDLTERPGVVMDGVVVKLVTPWHLGSDLDPNKIFLQWRNPGNDGAGATVVTHMAAGAEILRRQYNAHALKQSAQVGGNLEAYIVFPDVVFQNSEMIGAVANAGFYGPAVAGTIGTVVNNSTRPYVKPLGAWVNTQLDRATGTHFHVELAVADRHARNGQQVARVEFTATDQHGHTTAVHTVTTPTLSTIQTLGNIAEVFAADIDLSALTHGDFCQVKAKAFSWVGDSTAVLDLAEYIETANPQTALRFVNDKAGTYGGGIAYVRQGAGGTGVVSRNDATARAAPFATMVLAFAALAAFNNANSVPAHNDHSGSVIYLMDDGASGAVAHTIAGTISTAAGGCWTDVRPDPLAVGAVTLNMSVSRSVPNRVRFYVNIDHTGGAFDGGSGGGSKMIAFAGGTINSSGSTPLNWRNGYTWLSNVTINASADLVMLAGYTTTRTQPVLALGVIAENAVSDGRSLAFAMIGCRTKRIALQEQNPASVTTWDSQDGRFVYNNTMLDIRSTGTISGLGVHRAYSIGMAVIQNVIEVSGGNGSGLGQTALRVGGDGTIRALDNVLLHHNTFVGGRLNVGYADVAGAVSVIKRIHLFGNLGNDTFNSKSDTFLVETTTRGRVGNWELRYHIGNMANVFASGSASGATLQPNGSSWLGERAHPSNRFNVGIANIHFANDQSQPVGNGPLGGDYDLIGETNAAYDAVPAGLAVLRFDQAGRVRFNNGAGAAGCFEKVAA